MSDTEAKMYVVVRGGLRVSDQEYVNPSEAVAEANHWKEIVKRWPDGSVIEIVEKDEKKHKIS